MGIILSVDTLNYFIGVSKNNYSHVIATLMFYEHRKTTVFKVLGSVIYYIIDKQTLLGYLCLQKDKLSSNNKTF